jgi:glycosyltransferase involved in cell wall biosynthesis
MNVAIFTDNDFSKVNGVRTALRAILDHAPADVHARIYTCEHRRIELPGYLAMKGVGLGIPFYREMRVYVPPVRRFVRQAEADAIDLIHFTTPGPVGLAAMHVASTLRLPMIGSFHTDLTAYTRQLSGSEWLSRLMREYLRWPYGRCERIFVPSEATRQTLVQDQIEPAKIRIWRRGVSSEQFTPAKRCEALRRRWKVSAERLALLYVGRLSREKGLDTLQPLSARLRSTGIDHQLVIAGDGPMRRELAASVPGAVFLGTLSEPNVAAAMASADLFVFPSRTDTAGNVVLEAQASGLPVLVTDEGGPQENMIDGTTGHVCGDLRTFARRVAELTWSTARRQRFADAARAYALERTWEASLAPLFDAYRSAARRELASAPASTRDPSIGQIRTSM